MIKKSCFPIIFKLSEEQPTEDHHFNDVTLEHLIKEPLLLNVVVMWSNLPSPMEFANE
jgi:hypothetical protein